MAEADRETLEAEVAGTIEAPAPKPVSRCEAVPPGGTCAHCGWNWSSLEPHAAYFGQARNEQIPNAVPEKKAGPAPAANACDAINLTATCPKCGWNYETEMKSQAPKPHPILAV